MAYLMDEIDEAATQRRLDEITTSGVRAFEEAAERSAAIDEEARETNARQEAEVKAMEKELAEREGVPAEEDQPAASVPWPTRESKPRVLSFEGEDFAEQADAPTPPTGFTEPPPAPAPAPEQPAPPAPSGGHLLSFGAEEDEEPPPVPPRPAPPALRPRHQAPADDDDDDFSGQSWVR
jgi:hypothetical protein